MTEVIAGRADFYFSPLVNALPLLKDGQLQALAVSGLPTDRFSFEGFLPRKQGERQRLWETLAHETRTMIFFESPHRILESLESALAVLGSERQATVSRELTKKFEQTVRGTLAQLVEWAKTGPKGEMVVVLAGAEATQHQALDVVDQVLELVAAGSPLKPAVAEVAQAAEGAAEGRDGGEPIPARRQPPGV